MANMQRNTTQNSQTDLVNIILEDHKPLKRLINIMKNSDKDKTERADAFAEFAPLFNHSCQTPKNKFFILI